MSYAKVSDGRPDIFDDEPTVETECGHHCPESQVVSIDHERCCPDCIEQFRDDAVRHHLQQIQYTAEMMIRQPSNQLDMIYKHMKSLQGLVTDWLDDKDV